MATSSGQVHEAAEDLRPQTQDHAIGGFSAGAGARWWPYDRTYRRALRGERAAGH
jgi:hypothetical protein